MAGRRSLSRRELLYKLAFAATPITSRELAEYLGLDSRSVAGRLRALVERGYATRRGRCYEITERGLKLLRRRLEERLDRILGGVGPGEAFYLRREPDKLGGVRVRSLEELVEAVRYANPLSVKYHLERGDLKSWIEDVLGDDYLAHSIASSLEPLVGTVEAPFLRDFLYDLASSRLSKLRTLAKALRGHYGEGESGI